MSDQPLTLEQLEARWQPPGKTPAARCRWLLQRMQQLGLHSFIPGRGRSMRFRPADVHRAEERGVAQHTPLTLARRSA